MQLAVAAAAAVLETERDISRAMELEIMGLIVSRGVDSS